MDKQSAVMFLGGALVVANLVINGELHAIANVIVNGQEVHNGLALRDFFLELAFLAFLVFLASLGDAAGNVALAMVVALWLAFLVHHGGF